MSNHSSSPRPNIRSMPLCDSDKIAFNEAAAEQQQQKILTLRQSPRADHKAIASFVAKQDSSDDAQSILELDESPSESRRRRDEERAADRASSSPGSSSIVVPDEVIELTNGSSSAAGVAGLHDLSTASAVLTKKPPIKSLRKSREHVYETIGNDRDDDADDDGDATTLAATSAPVSRGPSELDVNANATASPVVGDEDVCQLVKVREHHMETIEVVSIASDRSMRASSLKRDVRDRNKTPEKKVTFGGELEECRTTFEGQIVKELVGTRYGATVLG